MLGAAAEIVGEFQVNVLIFFDYLTVTLFGPFLLAADGVLWLAAGVLLLVALA